MEIRASLTSSAYRPRQALTQDRFAEMQDSPLSAIFFTLIHATGWLGLPIQSKKSIVVAPQALSGDTWLRTAKCGQAGGKWGKPAGKQWPFLPTDFQAGFPHVPAMPDVPGLSTRSPAIRQPNPGVDILPSVSIAPRLCVQFCWPRLLLRHSCPVAYPDH